MEILARTAGIERVLVVSPTSLKHQWKQEIERFTDREALEAFRVLADGGDFPALARGLMQDELRLHLDALEARLLVHVSDTRGAVEIELTVADLPGD